MENTLISVTSWRPSFTRYYGSVIIKRKVGVLVIISYLDIVTYINWALESIAFYTIK